MLAPYVRFVHEIELPAGTHLKERTIYDCEFVYVVNGSGTLRMEDRTHAMNSGDLLYIRPYLANELFVDQDAPMLCFAVHFDFVYLGEAMDFSAFSVYLGYPDTSGERDEAMLNTRPRIELTDLDIPERLQTAPVNKFYELFQSLRHHFEHPGPDTQLQLRADMLLLIRLIHQATTTNGIKHGTPNADLVLQAVAYIEEHFAEKMTVPALARKALLSPKYFGTQFKQATGLSISQYILQVRIERAKTLLQRHTMSIQQIAQQVGFEDVYYFSKAFKSMEGLSPSRYAASLSWSKLEER
jgi:AraC-like DNA-binding protein